MSRTPQPIVIQLVRLLCCITAFACGTAFAQTPRLVKVVVTVESNQFRKGLKDVKRQKIESTVASALARDLAVPFPIIDWKVDTGTQVPAAVLTAAVIEVPPTDTESGAEIYLVWRAKADEDFEMPGIKRKLLYSANTSDRPIDDFGGQFTSRLLKEARIFVDSDSTIKELKTAFIKQVLLSKQVVPANSDFVIVNLPYKDAKIRGDSVLRVKYMDPGAGPEARKVFTLTGMVFRDMEPMRGDTQTHLKDCVAGGKSTSDPAIGWAKCIVPLSSSPPKAVEVFVDPYELDPHPDADVSSGVIFQE